MEGGKANRYAALRGGEGGGRSKFCQKVRYVMVERSHTPCISNKSILLIRRGNFGLKICAEEHRMK